MTVYKKPRSLMQLTDYYNFSHVISGMSNLLRDYPDQPFRENPYDKYSTPVFYDMFREIRKNGAINSYNIYQLTEDTLDVYMSDLSRNKRQMNNIHDYPHAKLMDNTDKFLDHILITEKRVTQSSGKYPSLKDYHANSLSIITDHVRLNTAAPYILTLTSSALSVQEEIVRHKAEAIDYKLGKLAKSRFESKESRKKSVLYLKPPENTPRDNADSLLASMSRRSMLPQFLPGAPANP